MRFRHGLIVAAALGLVACGKGNSGSSSTSSSSTTTTTGSPTSGTSGTHSSSTSGSSGTTGTNASNGTTTTASNASSSSSGTTGVNASTGSTGTTASNATTGSTGTTATTATTGSTGGTTGGPPPANDVCSGAIALVPGTPVTASTLDATQDTTTDCGGNSGPDIYYSLHLASDSHVTLDLTTTDTNFQPVLAIRTSCTPNTDGGAVDLSCGGGSGASANVDLTDVPAGDYIVVVDGYGGSSGPFTLTTTVGAAIPPPANDKCAAATALTVAAVGDTQTVAGDTSAAVDDGTATCGGSGPDVFYTFTTTAASHLTATATPTGTTLDPVIDLLTSCDFANLVSCGSSSSGAGTAGTLDIHNLPAGTYTLVVDGYSGSKGAFSLDVTLAAPVPPPANDTCATATALTVTNVGDTQTVTGDTTDAHADYTSPACNGSASPDVFYSLHLAAPAHLSAQVGPGTGSSLQPFVALVTSCGSADAGPTEVGCNFDPNGGTGGIEANLAAGDYLLVVDGLDAQDPFGGPPTPSSGTFSLTVTASAALTPPANDACTGAIALTPTNVGDTQTVTGDTTAATSDYSNQVCGMGGPDVFYALNLATDAHVVATMTQPDGGALVGALAILDGCPVTSELSCTDGSGFGGDATLENFDVPAGTHYLIADSANLAGGPFSLTVTLSAAVPPPANDTCAGAATLTLGFPDGGGAVNGTNVAATNNYVADPTGNSCTGFSLNGPDVVYSFTAPSNGDFVFTVTPVDATNGPDLALYVVDACPTGPITTCVAGADATFAGQPETVTATLTQGTTYLVIVDAYQADQAGAFTLQVTGP